MISKVQKKPGKKNAGRGATREQKNAENNWQFWKLLGVACVPLLLIVLLLNLDLGATKPSEIAVEKVTVLGELKYVDKANVIERISQQLEGGFFTVDIRAIQKSLEQEPWIKTAAIKRIWPATLEVTVTEQVVVAKWGNKAFLTREAKLLEPDPVPLIDGLPTLEGNSKNLELVWQQYQLISEHLAKSDLRVTHLRHGADGSWQLTTDKGFNVIFGAEHFAERLERFQLVYEKTLKSRVLQLGRVDLRYSNGLAVEWQEPAGQVVQSIR